MKLPKRCAVPFLTVYQYVADTQPDVAKSLQEYWPFVLPEKEKEELTPYQKFLDKMMRQKPRPGKGGG